MKKHNILIISFLAFLISACDSNVLDLESLNQPVDATFYSNEDELELALTGAYKSIIYYDNYYPLPMIMDNAATDIGVSRAVNSGGFIELGAGTHSATTAGFQEIYSKLYSGIARANALLDKMQEIKSEIPERRYNEIQGQALVIRAYHYMYLTELFGDVPYIDKIIRSTSDALLLRTEKSVIVEKILSDLQVAAGFLPNTWPSAEKGRITKGVALGLRARIALYNENYSQAAISAKEVIDNQQAMGYSLHPDYKELFQTKGQSSAEIMLRRPSLDGFSTNNNPRAQGSRNLGAYSLMVPTQSMIDSYEAIDGKPIDESDVYDPKYPFVNRDPRLLASIITPQSEWAGIIFESHPDSTKYRFTNGNIAGNNADCRTVSWPAAFCGYLWKKNTIEEIQAAKQAWDDHDFTLMRYAEILLIYAEAKIELGEIDDSVLNAINSIRARAYGVSVASTSEYPAVTIAGQSKMREIIRRERKVELADEGFRLFDIRRWEIAEKVMPVTLIGRILNPAKATGVPDIDEDGYVSYSGIEAQYDLNTDERFPNAFRIFNATRDYLCPIPQQEIDTYEGLGGTLEQNPGY